MWLLRCTVLKIFLRHFKNSINQQTKSINQQISSTKICISNKLYNKIRPNSTSHNHLCISIRVSMTNNFRNNRILLPIELMHRIVMSILIFLKQIKEFIKNLKLHSVHSNSHNSTNNPFYLHKILNSLVINLQQAKIWLINIINILELITHTYLKLKVCRKVVEFKVRISALLPKCQTREYKNLIKEERRIRI